MCIVDCGRNPKRDDMVGDELFETSDFAGWPGCCFNNNQQDGM